VAKRRTAATLLCHAVARLQCRTIATLRRQNAATPCVYDGTELQCCAIAVS
jgi:hypothetical protein